MAAARDGSLQLGFGLGKYTNRNVMDGYAGISRGVEQVTVRGSRRLSPEPECTVIGPVRYEAVEPMRGVRSALEPNDRHPIACARRLEQRAPPLEFHPENRRLQGGHIDATTEDGVTRRLQVEVVSDTGFHLGAGLYFGFDGHHHGEWRGDLGVDGERIANCADPAMARRLHQ